jgi:hypothetical protein
MYQNNENDSLVWFYDVCCIFIINCNDQYYWSMWKYVPSFIYNLTIHVPWYTNLKNCQIRDTKSYCVSSKGTCITIGT